jgi:hypothetical protein
MDELKQLIDMVDDLPHAALWVIAAILAYKAMVIGSIYGVIRLAITKLHDWATTRKAREVEYKEIRPTLDGMCIKSATEPFIAQLYRLKGKGLNISSEYIHDASVEWLRLAIDEKIARDEAKGAP